MKNPKYWSLKSRVTWSVMIVVVFISLAISLLYYNSQRRLFERNLMETSRNDITYLMGNIEKQLRLCQKLSDWVYINRQIENTLVRGYLDMQQYSREIPPIQRLIDGQLLSSSVGNYVIFFIIQGNNGVSYKAMRDADWVLNSDLVNLSWYAESMNAGGRIVWTGISENPARYKTVPSIIPIVRPIVFSDTRLSIGWHVIAFSPALIGDVFQDYHMDENRRVIVVDQYNRAVFHYDRRMTGKTVQYGFLDELKSAGSGSRFMELDGRRVLVTYTTSDYSGMTMLLIHSLVELEAQTDLTLYVLFATLAITGIMFFALTYYLSNRLTKPLAGILDKLKDVSGGVFDVDRSIDGNDEMGLIGRGINEMAGNIGSLMDELITREHEKGELEYRVLLNQVNPHFVYNVLNSIKVMADIQKIEGISEMAASLGNLLKEISKGSAEQVSLKRELELLESYLYLQKIRRCGLLTVTYDIPDESVLTSLIPRFTLQPIAENAIYHGLDRAGRMGVIHISIKPDGDDILIVIKDNGAGIPKDRISGLLEAKNAKDGEMTSIGLINVDTRIKLYYGSGGLELESAEGEYTSVSLRFPRKEDKCSESS